MSRRHVRVLAALFAAIALHALLLSWSLPAFKPVSLSNGLLHVELLKSASTEPRQAKAAAPAVIATSPAESHRHADKPKVRQKVRRAVRPNAVKHHLAAVRQRNAVPEPVAQSALMPVTKPVDKASVAASRQPERQSKQAAHAAVAVAAAKAPVRQGRGESAAQRVRSMPASAQSMLLANIRYPRLARRRGWQGKGEFQLAIVSQSIRSITTLASTGHAILDRAVERGLSGVDHIPVADGQYRLPVAFRLQ